MVQFTYAQPVFTAFDMQAEEKSTRHVLLSYVKIILKVSD